MKWTLEYPPDNDQSQVTGFKTCGNLKVQRILFTTLEINCLALKHFLRFSTLFAREVTAVPKDSSAEFPDAVSTSHIFLRLLKHSLPLALKLDVHYVSSSII